MPEKAKMIPQWFPTKEQRKHIEDRAAESGLTLTGYIKSLVNADMRKKR